MLRMSIKSVIALFLILSAQFASAQLRDFEITPVQNNRIPVFRDHPEMAAVIVNSSLTNLRFDSNLEIVATLGNPNQGEYILIVRPVRQILSVNTSGYQQGRIQISLTEARQVVYYKVEPKPEVDTNVIPTNFLITPVDAIVSIDGTQVDASKPVLIEIGTHTLKIEKQGYRTLEKEVRIGADQNFIREALSAIEPVSLSIRTQPAGATILIDGVLVGVTDRNGALGMFRFPGNYELTVQLSGYVPEVRSITVSEAGPNAFTSTLQRNSGTLQLRVTPVDALVLLNREPHDASAAAELAPGMYRIEVSKEGYEPFLETVEISRGQTATRTIALVAHLGGLQITTAPLEATWSLTNAAGAVVASGAGLARKTGIPVGNYSLVVKASGHQDHSEGLRIERDRVIERSVALREVQSLVSGQSLSAAVSGDADQGRMWATKMASAILPNGGPVTGVSFESTINQNDMSLQVATQLLFPKAITQKITTQGIVITVSVVDGAGSQSMGSTSLSPMSQDVVEAMEKGVAGHYVNVAQTLATSTVKYLGTEIVDRVSAVKLLVEETNTTWYLDPTTALPLRAMTKEFVAAVAKEVESVMIYSNWTLADGVNMAYSESLLNNGRQVMSTTIRSHSVD